MNKFLIILLFILTPLVSFGQTSVFESIKDLTELPIGNFGGRVLFVTPCTCPVFPGFLLYVLDPRLFSSGDLTKIKDVKDIKSLKNAGLDALVKKVKFIPFLSRLNMNYMFTPGNQVLGTHFSPETISNGIKILAKLPGLSGLSAGNNMDYFTGCYQYALIACIPSPDAASDGVVTPYPFSGMGTSLTP